jgi:defect-in-organelle-trafficking protein DotB
MRESIANDLLGVLRYIVVQTLLRTVDGKRQAVREYIIFDDELRERLRDMPFTHWGRHIDAITKLEKRRIADQAWFLFLEGRIDRAELVQATTPSQLLELEARRAA